MPQLPGQRVAGSARELAKEGHTGLQAANFQSEFAIVFLLLLFLQRPSCWLWGSSCFLIPPSICEPLSPTLTRFMPVLGFTGFYSILRFLRAPKSRCLHFKFETLPMNIFFAFCLTSSIFAVFLVIFYLTFVSRLFLFTRAHCDVEMQP